MESHETKAVRSGHGYGITGEGVGEEGVGEEGVGGEAGKSALLKLSNEKTIFYSEFVFFRNRPEQHGNLYPIGLN